MAVIDSHAICRPIFYRRRNPSPGSANYKIKVPLSLGDFFYRIACLRLALYYSGQILLRLTPVHDDKLMSHTKPQDICTCSQRTLVPINLRMYRCYISTVIYHQLEKRYKVRIKLPIPSVAWLNFIKGNSISYIVLTLNRSLLVDSYTYWVSFHGYVTMTFTFRCVGVKVTQIMII